MGKQCLDEIILDQPSKNVLGRKKICHLNHYRNNKGRCHKHPWGGEDVPIGRQMLPSPQKKLHGRNLRTFPDQKKNISKQAEAELCQAQHSFS